MLPQNTDLGNIAALDFSFREAFPVFPHYLLDEVDAVQTCRSNNRADDIKSSIAATRQSPRAACAPITAPSIAVGLTLESTARRSRSRRRMGWPTSDSGSFQPLSRRRPRQRRLTAILGRIFIITTVRLTISATAVNIVAP